MSYSHSNTDSRYLQVTEYENDLVVNLRQAGIQGGKSLGGRRGSIQGFSAQSKKRFRLYLRNANVKKWVALVGLTYPGEYPSDGRVVKDHLNAFLQYLRRLGVRYTWVLEFQSRGAPHYHLIADRWLPMWACKQRWYEIVGTENPDHLDAGCEVEGVRSQGKIKGYLLKYLNKDAQKAVPEDYEGVGRFWGMTRGLVAPRSVIRSRYTVNMTTIKRTLRDLRRAYERKLKGWGIKWRWVRGGGFTGWEMAAVFRQLTNHNPGIFGKLCGVPQT